jgi:hypothetical protein
LADLDLSGDQSAQDQDKNAGVTPAANQIVDYSNEPAGPLPEPSFKVLDVSKKEGAGPPPPPQPSKPYNQAETQENTRGDLARGLLWLLTFAVGGVLVFIGLGRLDGTVLTQSIFPSLVALAGTALGFYFGSQTVKESDSSQRASTNGSSGSTGSATSDDTGGAGQKKTDG